MATPSNVPFPRLSVGRGVVVPATLLSVNVDRRRATHTLVNEFEGPIPELQSEFAAESGKTMRCKRKVATKVRQLALDIT